MKQKGAIMHSDRSNKMSVFIKLPPMEMLICINVTSNLNVKIG